VLFLVTEFPQGVTNLLNGILTGFVDEVYASLGDLLDILALINQSISQSMIFTDAGTLCLCVRIIYLIT